MTSTIAPATEDRRLSGTVGPAYPTLVRNTETALRRGWHPVCLTDELDEDPLAVRLLGELWVLRRDEDDQPRARTAVDGVTVEAFGAVDHLGHVWVAPEQPVAALLPAPEMADRAFARGWLPVARTSAAAGLIVDNQLDVSHFPYVHTTTFGTDADPFVPPYEISRTPAGFTASVEHAFRNVQDPGVEAGVRPLIQTRRVTYTFALPFQLQLRIDHLATGQRTVILFGLHPVAEAETRFTTCILRNDMPGFPGSAQQQLPALLAFEERVVREDLRLQEQFDVPGLPLLPALELPIRADACGLELRRLLRDLCTPA